MQRRLPITAVLLGVAGLIPFVVCALGALNGDPVMARRALTALVAYGAVILAFLGGVHWGFALGPAPLAPAIPAGLEPANPQIRDRPLPDALVPVEAEARAEAVAHNERRRLILGAVPSLIGWVAVLLPLYLPPWTGIAVLIAGFAGTAVAEQRTATRIWMPRGYMVLRWGLTVAVVLILALVLLQVWFGPSAIAAP